MKETYDLVTYRHKEDLPKEQLFSAAKLYCRIWKEKPWEEKWTIKNASDALLKVFSRENGRLILCLLNGDVCGFISGQPTTLEELQKRAGEAIGRKFETDDLFSISEIGLDESHRGHGLGRRLLADLMEQARAEHKNIHFVLHTDKRAESAKRLYQRLGFQDTGVLDLEFPSHTYWIRY